MHIAFGFYGIIHGAGGRTGSDRDFRHCWPNINEMVINPFRRAGHTADIYFAGYPVSNKEVMDDMERMVKPKHIFYSQFEGSDPFTAKGNLVNNLIDVKADVIVFTRSDVHWSRRPSSGKIDWKKFNFLFKEQGWWEEWGFACDNFYIYPKHMAANVAQAMHECYAWPRGKPLVDTHGLIHKLTPHHLEMNFMSDVHEISDVNSWYTCCRSGLPEDGRGGYIHPDVKERFGYV
jgi:hypothetical protein